jgi:hypothetical protein
MHVNKFGDMKMNTHDVSVSVIRHNQNLRADLIEPHIHTSALYDVGDNICTMIDACDVLQSNKLHPVYLTTSAEFFEKRSPTNCLFYTKLAMPTDVNHMLENISEIKSSRSLNIDHSCKVYVYFNWRTCCKYILCSCHLHNE